MWNKIGELLNYPETWCSFIIRSSLLVCSVLGVLFVLLSPLLIFIIEGATVDFYFVSCFVIFVYYCVHLVAKDHFDGYRDLLDKLPKCPKIKWNEGDNDE